MKHVVLFVMSVLTFTVSCRSPDKLAGASEAKEFENSLAVCSDVQNATESRPDLSAAPEEEYRRIKVRELRILEDLLVQLKKRQAQLEKNAKVSADDPVLQVCPGCDLEAVRSKLDSYERQQQRLNDCAYQAESSNEKDFIKRRNEEKREVLIGEILKIDRLNDLCLLGNKVLIAQRTPVCRSQILTTTCNKVTGDGLAVESRLLTDYRAALVECTRSMAGETAATAADTFLVETKKELDLNNDLEHAVLLGACRSAARVVGDFAATTPTVDYDNACKNANPITRFGRDKTWLASCMRTAVDICEVFIAQNGLNLANLVPADKNAKNDLLRQLALGIDFQLCGKDPQIALWCRVTRKASDQILQAIRTGNNDWAHCVGTDQMGACVGKLWAAGGWTNDSAIATATTATATSGETFTTRQCCWCQKDYYANDGWVKDTRYRRSNWFGVIQQGDVASGSCKAKEKGTFPGDRETKYNGYDTYYRYSECDMRYVAGSTCAVSPGSKQQVWDPAKKQWFTVTVP